MENTNDLGAKFSNSSSGFIACWQLFLERTLNISETNLVSLGAKRR